MVRRSLSVLVALITMSRFIALTPLAAFAAVTPDANAQSGQEELQGWSIEQLCAARPRPEVWAEIERRDIFSGRELRAIEKEQVREGMSEQSVQCFKGWPDSIISGISAVSGDPVDAWTYPADEDGALVVYFRRTAEESTVLTALETDDARAMAPVASMRLVCKYSANKVRCNVDESGMRRSGTDVSVPVPNSGSGSSVPQ
jgi:hypothetical protein